MNINELMDQRKKVVIELQESLTNAGHLRVKALELLLKLRKSLYSEGLPEGKIPATLDPFYHINGIKSFFEAVSTDNTAVSLLSQVEKEHSHIKATLSRNGK